MNSFGFAKGKFLKAGLFARLVPRLEARNSFVTGSNVGLEAFDTESVGFVRFVARCLQIRKLFVLGIELTLNALHQACNVNGHFFGTACLYQKNLDMLFLLKTYFCTWWNHTQNQQSRMKTEPNENTNNLVLNILGLLKLVYYPSRNI